MSSSSRRPHARRLSGNTLEKERRGGGGGGGMRGCLSERQVDEERRDGRLGDFSPEQDVMLVEVVWGKGGGGAWRGIPPSISIIDYNLHHIIN